MKIKHRIENLKRIFAGEEGVLMPETRKKGIRQICSFVVSVLKIKEAVTVKKSKK